MAIKINKVHDGYIHAAIGNYLTDMLVVLFAAAAISTQSWIWLPRLAIIWIGSRLATYAVSPDFDISKSVPKRHWGILGIVWEPYSRFFKHRSFWTHGLYAPKNIHNRAARVLIALFGFAVGTTLRIAYILALLFIACTIADWAIGISFFKEGFQLAVMSFATPWLAIGFLLSDAIHVNFDRI